MGRLDLSGAETGTYKVFRTTLPLPPSTNRLYQRTRKGGLSLTDTAKQFQEDVKRSIRDFLPKLAGFPLDHDTVYQCNITLYFEQLENPGWFETWEKDKYYTKDSKDGKHKKGELKCEAGKRKAESRYKVIDYDNRIKFLQDCIVSAIGIPDDCQIFRGEQEKREDPNNPRADVEIRVRHRDEFFEERREDAKAT